MNFLYSKLRISARWQRRSGKSLTEVTVDAILAAVCDFGLACGWSGGVLKMTWNDGNRSESDKCTTSLWFTGQSRLNDIFFCVLLTLLCLWMKLMLSSSAVATATKKIATKIDFMAVSLNFTKFSTFRCFLELPLLNYDFFWIIKSACFLVDLKFWNDDSTQFENKCTLLTHRHCGVDGAVWKLSFV